MHLFITKVSLMQCIASSIKYCIDIVDVHVYRVTASVLRKIDNQFVQWNIPKTKLENYKIYLLMEYYVTVSM